MNTGVMCDDESGSPDVRKSGRPDMRLTEASDLFRNHGCHGLGASAGGWIPDIRTSGLPDGILS
jgi:hypothetical protein